MRVLAVHCKWLLCYRNLAHLLVIIKNELEFGKWLFYTSLWSVCTSISRGRVEQKLSKALKGTIELDLTFAIQYEGVVVGAIDILDMHVLWFSNELGYVSEHSIAILKTKLSVLASPPWIQLTTAGEGTTMRQTHRYLGDSKVYQAVVWCWLIDLISATLA